MTDLCPIFVCITEMESILLGLEVQCHPSPLEKIINSLDISPDPISKHPKASNIPLNFILSRHLQKFQTKFCHTHKNYQEHEQDKNSQFFEAINRF